MSKKIINIIELVIIGFIINGIFGFHETANSTPRYRLESDIVRLEIDLLIIFALIFRAVKINENFKKKYSEIGNTNILEKVVYICCLILFLPDLVTWYQWNYFADLYLHLFIIFSLPIIFWTIEMIERRKSSQQDKTKCYGLAFLLFVIPIIGFTLYLGQLK